MGPGESKNDSETNEKEYENLRSLNRFRQWAVILFVLSSIILFTWAIIYDEINYVVLGIAVLVTITVGLNYLLTHEPGSRIQDK
jgi:hydrogenase-4 membrane subunit HyfE